MQMAAFVKTMNKFGIIQIARTGRLVLKRGASLFSGGDYTFQQDSQQEDSNGVQATNDIGKSTRSLQKSFPLEEHHDVYAGGSIEGMCFVMFC
jgi:hypothetical protein